MNQPVSPVGSIPEDLAEMARRPDECLEAIMPALRALEATTLIHYFTDSITASGQVLAKIERIRSLDAAMRDELPRFDRSLVASLGPYAIALALLHGQTEARRAPVEGGRERLAAARKLRARLHLSAAFLVESGSISPNVLARIARLGHGYTDTSEAILGYIEAHFTKGKALLPRSPSTREELDQAREDAIELVAKRVESMQRDPGNVERADLERRAYHLLVTTYNKVRSAVLFLRYDFGDADAFAPALGQRARSPRRASP